MAPWNQLGPAGSMHADVLLLGEGDDTYVSAPHAERFQAARPTTQNAALEAGGAADPSSSLSHGPEAQCLAASLPAYAGDRASTQGLTGRTTRIVAA